ncbi:MAG TPA: hypothetical protein VMW89_01825 [Desulfatiglandales bacterium]|nr:hypothetical protein [Desulfatiglandales bacterium]
MTRGKEIRGANAFSLTALHLCLILTPSGLNLLASLIIQMKLAAVNCRVSSGIAPKSRRHPCRAGALAEADNPCNKLQGILAKANKGRSTDHRFTPQRP